MKTLEERFFDYVDITEDCWLWNGLRDKDDYGQIRKEGKMVKVHRLSLEWSLGRPIGEGLVTRHKCRNRNCVNPEHLEEGTIAENNADKIRDGTSIGPRGTKHGSCKLTEDQVLAIREDQRTQKEIAIDYGITHHTVSDIKIGKSWGWL